MRTSNVGVRVAGLCLAGAFALNACSSDASSAGAGGTSATGGGAGHAGASASAGGGAGGAGSPGIPGSSGSSAGGANNGGTANAGAGGSAGTAGSAGLSAMGGTGGSSGAGGSGGALDCAGRALSLSANGTGNASDDASARVVIDLMSDLPLGNASRTLELWAFMKDSDWTANTNTLFFYGPDPSARNADGFGLDFGSKMGSTGTIDPFTNAIFDNDDQSSGVMTTMNQWVHFAMTWNGTAVQAYVNGVLKATKTSDGTQKVLMTGSSPLTIGGYPAEHAYFAGYIDEFRVWNVARSASDITATMHKTLLGNETGLVGYWKFNEESGTSAADSTTTAGHIAHPGALMATSPAQNPTFIVPNPPAPVSCP
jgi:hypothetical protein